MKILLGAMWAVASLALAGSAWAVPVVLDPIDWDSAGIGFRSGGDLGRISFRCYPDVPGVCEGASRIPITSSAISISQGDVQFSADLVSSISGNAWTHGLENISASFPAELESFEVTIAAFASFEVVSGGRPSATTEVAFQPNVAPPIGVIESDLLGPFFGRLDPVMSFVTGDRITLYNDFFIWWYSADNDDIGRDCGYTTGLDLSDCLVTVQISEPILSVPEPAPGALLGIALAALALARRRRA